MLVAPVPLVNIVMVAITAMQHRAASEVMTVKPAPGRYLSAQENLLNPKHIRIWYDPEGDFLEVTFEVKAGQFRATDNDHVMDRVDEAGNLLGFSVLGLRSLGNTPLDLLLPTGDPGSPQTYATLKDWLLGPEPRFELPDMTEWRHSLTLREPQSFED